MLGGAEELVPARSVPIKPKCNWNLHALPWLAGACGPHKSKEFSTNPSVRPEQHLCLQQTVDHNRQAHPHQIPSLHRLQVICTHHRSNSQRACEEGPLLDNASTNACIEKHSADAGNLRALGPHVAKHIKRQGMSVSLQFCNRARHAKRLHLATNKLFWFSMCMRGGTQQVASVLLCRNPTVVCVGSGWPRTRCT